MSDPNLINELHYLQRENYALECADDFLFCNGNGNRSLWESRQKRIREIQAILDQQEE